MKKLFSAQPQVATQQEPTQAYNQRFLRQMLSGGGNLYHQPIMINEWHYYMTDEISEPSDYLDLLHCLNTATELDSLYIHINSPGGRLDTAVQLMSAMETSQATVTTIIEGECSSAATMIFLKGENMMVAPHASMMVHSWAGGAIGKSNEVLSSITHSVKRIDRIFNEVYDKFLTPEELLDMSKGADLYFDAEEIVERLEKRGFVLLDENGKVPETPKEAEHESLEEQVSQ